MISLTQSQLTWPVLCRSLFRKACSRLSDEIVRVAESVGHRLVEIAEVKPAKPFAKPVHNHLAIKTILTQHVTAHGKHFCDPLVDAAASSRRRCVLHKSDDRWRYN